MVMLNHGSATYQPYSGVFGLAPVRSMLMYGCRGFEWAEEIESVGDGMETESKPLSGELGKTAFSGSGNWAEWGVAGESTERLDDNMRPCS